MQCLEVGCSNAARGATAKVAGFVAIRTDSIARCRNRRAALSRIPPRDFKFVLRSPLVPADERPVERLGRRRVVNEDLSRGLSRVPSGIKRPHGHGMRALPDEILGSDRARSDL